VSQITAEPPVVDLLGMLAYAELLAFDQMATDAKLAPDLTRRAVLSEMAGTEIVNHRQVTARLVELGADPERAMGPFRRALDDYHDQTQPKDWLEALTKAYVGDSIADDFVRAVAQGLGSTDQALILEVLHDTRYVDYAAEQIRLALADDPGAGNRLSMWARRLVGEALRQAQAVAAERPALAGLLPDDLGALLTKLTSAHTARMAAVGLNN
jgi:tRNA-(MS[2]IO[6]A)-hydroxylase (MiaE)-like